MSDENGAELVPKKRGGGPKTPEGKQRAKFNSMKHGMRAKVLLPEELVAVFEEHKVELTRLFAPRTKYEGWLVGEMAFAMAQLDRCADLSLGDLQRCLDIAAFDWDDDRRIHVENLGRRLASDPSRVSHALEQTRQGADWKIGRWEGIRATLRTLGACDDDLRRLMMDLMGVPPEVRGGDDPVPLSSDVAGLSGLVEREIARLRQRQECVLDDRDDASRSMAMAGMPYDEDPGTARLRRYESGIRRSLERARVELRRVRELDVAAAEPPETLGTGPLTTTRIGPAEAPPVERESHAPSRPVVDLPPPDVEEESPSLLVEAMFPVKVAMPDERATAAVPFVSRTPGGAPPSFKTAAHLGTPAFRNRFEQRAAKAEARRAAPRTAKVR